MAARRSSSGPTVPRATLSKRRLSNGDAFCLSDLGYPELDRDEFHEVELPGVLERLVKLQHSFETEHKFKEAEIVRVRLDKLRRQEACRVQDEKQSQQIAERLGVETAHMQELQEFNDVWDTKDAEFEMHVASLHQALQERHREALGAYILKIEAETEPRQPKWSKELLNNRKIQDTLAKQKNYVDAAKVKEEGDRLEKKEYSKWKALRDAKLGGLEEQFKLKQQMEMSGLMARIEANRAEHKQARKKELERLLQRYHNVKTQMETQQKIKQQKAERYKEADFSMSDAASSRSGVAGVRKAASTGRASATGSRPSTGGAGNPRSSQASGVATGRNGNASEYVATAAVQEGRSGSSSAGQAFAPPRRSASAAGSVPVRQPVKNGPAGEKRGTVGWR